MSVWRTSLVVLGILLASVVFLSCGGDDDDGGGGEATPGVFDGPYSFFNPSQIKKLKAFEFYDKKELSFSHASDVTEGDLFALSIAANRKSQYGDETQIYTYVIDDEGNILVASWNDGAQKTVGKMISKDKGHEICVDLNALSSEERKGRRDISSELNDLVIEKRMINFFPEEGEEEEEGLQVTPDVQGEEDVKESPCWLTVGGGLLDAQSKHFMLAQGLDDGKISNYEASEWVKSKVDYAGEIHVTVKQCTFEVDGGSGTYLPPLTSQKINQRLVLHFNKELDAAPTKVNDVDLQDLGGFDIRDLKDFNIQDPDDFDVKKLNNQIPGCLQATPGERTRANR